MDALSGCHYRTGAKKERSMSDRSIHRSKISPKPAESRRILRTDFTQTDYSEQDPNNDYRSYSHNQLRTRKSQEHIFLDVLVGLYFCY